MNAISFKTLLHLSFLCIIFFSSCGSTASKYSVQRNHSKDYTKNRTAKSSSKSHSASSNGKTLKAPPKVRSSNSASRSTTGKSARTERNSSTTSAAEREARTDVVMYASGLSGTPYVYGGKKPSGFDCSGFVSYVYGSQGVAIAGNSNYQATLGRKIPVHQAKEGDLIFFGNGNKISHVAIVVRQDKEEFVVIHSTSSKGVIQQDIKESEYWQSRILFARDLVGQMPLAE